MFFKDGIHWEHPKLNLTTSDAVPKPNNIVLGHGAGGTNGGGGMVLDQTQKKERFRLVTSKKVYSDLFVSARIRGDYS